MASLGFAHLEHDRIFVKSSEDIGGVCEVQNKKRQKIKSVLTAAGMDLSGYDKEK